MMHARKLQAFLRKYASKWEWDSDSEPLLVENLSDSSPSNHGPMRTRIPKVDRSRTPLCARVCCGRTPSASSQPAGATNWFAGETALLQAFDVLLEYLRIIKVL